MASAKLKKHLARDCYGDFLLTNAIRPSISVPVVPEEGYRIDFYRDEKAGLEVPVIVAAISRENLFDLFIDLLAPLGSSVDVVLESSHDSGNSASHRDLVRERVDLPVLSSYFCNYEDLLLNDGCTGVAIVSSEEAAEVQFDEHKIIVIYARDLEPFERLLLQHGIKRNDFLPLITEGEHIHNTAPEYQDQFEELAMQLGVGEPIGGVRW